MPNSHLKSKECVVTGKISLRMTKAVALSSLILALTLLAILGSGGRRAEARPGYTCSTACHGDEQSPSPYISKYKTLIRKYRKLRTISIRRHNIKIRKQVRIKNRNLNNTEIVRKANIAIRRYRKNRASKVRMYNRKINHLNSRIKKLYELLNRKLEVGVYMYKPYSDVPELTNKLTRKLGNFLWYQNMDVNFDIDLANWLWARGIKIQIAFESREIGKGANEQPNYDLKSISQGNHDEAIYRWARQIKEFGHPVYFRVMGEMNGYWIPWGGTANGNSPQDYIPAWRHIHNIFKEVGATNALFVWAPNHDHNEAIALETFSNYYPGDEFVDYVGIIGYNWGTMYSTPTWSSQWLKFDSVFGPSYRTFSKLTQKPIMIPEIASTYQGGDKTTWIRDSFLTIKEFYPRIKVITWLNIDKETDWRFSEDPASLEAFKTYAR